MNGRYITSNAERIADSCSSDQLDSINPRAYNGTGSFSRSPTTRRRDPQRTPGVRVRRTRMINYTERITLLVDDLVKRIPELHYIDPTRLLVFARFGRSHADGAYATCHCLTLPSSEPGYYFWRDRRSGTITRRSEWFITKSPTVQLGSKAIDYLISFCLPRFCDQSFARSRKHSLYPAAEPWLAKLDTIVPELYHVDPTKCGIRRIPRADGSVSPYAHSPEFFANVAGMVRGYLATGPDP